MGDTATDMVTAMAMATDTTATMARGRLSPPPLLRLLLSPDMATTAMDTVTATAMDTATATDMATVTTARGLLMPSPDTDTTATTVTAMDTVMDTVMATDTAMDTATMDREGTDC